MLSNDLFPFFYFQQSLSVSAQAAQLQQLQLLQQQLVQQSQLLQAQQSANKMQDEQPLIDSNLLNQIQALTNQLLSRTTDETPSKPPEPTFNKVTLHLSGVQLWT